MDLNNIVLAVKHNWCECANGKSDEPFSHKYSLEYCKGEEVLKHVVSYYQCPNCAGLIKVEES